MDNRSRVVLMAALGILWAAAATISAGGQQQGRPGGPPFQGPPPFGGRGRGGDIRPMLVPASDPLTPEKIERGRTLFFDARLSADGTIACATCHRPDRGFSDGRTVAVG